ncbi:MAG: CPBP family intramembrane metalloprotease [Saprospiraceae bacterium]|nr:CPBP family intramembrane metalloprotease [Saprospiraceae bacterium]
MNQTTASPIKITLLFLLFFAIIVVMPMIPSPQLGHTTIGNILAPIVLLLLTRYVYQKEGKNLSALGLTLKKNTITYFPMGVIVGILFFSLLLLSQAYQNGLSITPNPNANVFLILGGFLFLIISVLNEELIFRGYCFQQTLYHVGVTRANIIFAFLFIVYHWIALHAWGNWAAMLGLFTTGFGHFLFATAFLKSRTLYFPIGIHLGNNWAQRYLFSANMGGINNNPSNDTFFILNSSLQESSLSLTIFNYVVSILCFLSVTWTIWKWTKN